MSYRRNSYRKLKRIVRNGRGLDESTYVNSLTNTQKWRLIFWELTIPEAKK